MELADRVQARDANYNDFTRLFTTTEALLQVIPDEWAAKRVRPSAFLSSWFTGYDSRAIRVVVGGSAYVITITEE